MESRINFYFQAFHLSCPEVSTEIEKRDLLTAFAITLFQSALGYRQTRES